MSVRAAAGIFYGSITGNEWNTTADNQPFTVRQPFPTVKTLADPYGNLPGGVGPFPFTYDPASPRFALPAQVFGPSLDFVWPYTTQMNLTIEKEILRSFAVTASYVGALGRKLPASIDRNYPIYNSDGDYRQRQLAAAVHAWRHRLRRACSNRSSRATITRMQLSAERRGTRFSTKVYYTFGKAMEDRRLPGRRLAGGAELEPPRSRARDARRRIAGIASCCPAFWKPDYFAESRPLVRALLNDWTVSAILTLQSGTPLTICAGQRPELRRPHKRSRGHHRRSDAG